jgi:unsaturated rhamnogalacturonyl hydrolase
MRRFGKRSTDCSIGFEMALHATLEGILYHVFNAPEMWADGFNGAPPFLAAMGFYDESLAQIEGYWKRLWNPGKKLLAHIWDDDRQLLKDGRFWGGGNGWAAAGLARVWRSLPTERQSERERLADFAREIVDGCLRYQRPDGLFHDVSTSRRLLSKRTLLRCCPFLSMKE